MKAKSIALNEYEKYLEKCRSHFIKQGETFNISFDYKFDIILNDNQTEDKSTDDNVSPIAYPYPPHPNTIIFKPVNKRDVSPNNVINY